MFVCVCVCVCVCARSHVGSFHHRQHHRPSAENLGCHGNSKWSAGKLGEVVLALVVVVVVGAGGEGYGGGGLGKNLVFSPHEKKPTGSKSNIF